MDRLKDTFTLSTGRTFTANKGIIGLPVGDTEYVLCEGYDGPISDEHGVPPEDWTQEELVEIADYMIERWQAFRQSACSGAGHRFRQ